MFLVTIFVLCSRTGIADLCTPSRRISSPARALPSSQRKYRRAIVPGSSPTLPFYFVPTLDEREIRMACPFADVIGPRRPFRVPRWHADPGSVEHRFRNAIDANIGFNERIGQRHGAKRCEAEPGSHKTKRLTKVAGVNQDGAIYTRGMI